MVTDMVPKFWQWFLDNRPTLEVSSADIAAGLVTTELADIDLRLSAEISFDDEEPELIISANGIRELFETVQNLVDATPVGLNWTVSALKPPRGFNFEITKDGSASIDASSLKFNPLKTSADPQSVGISIALPRSILNRADVLDIAKLIIETGIGEAAASEIDFLDVASVHGTDEWLPIEDLGRYLYWHKTRCG